MNHIFNRELATGAALFALTISVDSMPDVVINAVAGWVRVVSAVCPALFWCV